MEYTNLLDDPEESEYSPAERAVAASRSTWVSVAVNLLLTSTQIVAGILTKSQGLIADGIHSLSDLVADFVVLRADPRQDIANVGAIEEVVAAGLPVNRTPPAR